MVTTLYSPIQWSALSGACSRLFHWYGLVLGDRTYNFLFRLLWRFVSRTSTITTTVMTNQFNKNMVKRRHNCRAHTRATNPPHNPPTHFTGWPGEGHLAALPPLLARSRGQEARGCDHCAAGVRALQESGADQKPGWPSRHERWRPVLTQWGWLDGSRSCRCFFAYSMCAKGLYDVSLSLY